MNNIIVALIIVLSVNALLMISQNAVSEMNPAAGQFYTGEGGMLEHKDLNNTNVYDDLPKSGGSVQGDSGNIFTDITGTILSWLGKVSGFDGIVSTVKAPYSFLNVMGLPSGMANLIGTIWYIVTLGLLFLVITGRY